MLEQLEQGQQQQSKMRATQYDVHASLLASLGDLRRDRVLASHHAQQVLAVTSDIKRELSTFLKIVSSILQMLFDSLS